MGTPALQPLTDNVFFRTEATNMLKQKDGTPGPNPIRTHFLETGKRRPGGRAKAWRTGALERMARQLIMSENWACRYVFGKCFRVLWFVSSCDRRIAPLFRGWPEGKGESL